jgi:hypothetical protein
VTWTLSSPAFGGEFRVWLVNQATSVWYVNKQVRPGPSQTLYSVALPASVPAGKYRAAVYWRPVIGAGTWQATAKSSSFPITALTISAPAASAVWQKGSAQTVTWTMLPAVSSGEFRVWLISPSGAWYVNKQVTPVPGQTVYGTSVVASVPAGAGYRVAVYWRPTAGSGSWLATAKSGLFTVASLSVTQPAAASTWPRLRTQTVVWSVAPAVDTGEFRVSLVSPSGTWYVNKVVRAVDDQTAYNTSVYLNLPAASGYKAAVYWRPVVGSGSWVLTQKSGAFTVV